MCDDDDGQLDLLAAIYGDDWRRSGQSKEFSVRIRASGDDELWLDCSGLSSQARYPCLRLRRLGPGLSSLGEQVPISSEADARLRAIFAESTERGEGYLYPMIDWLKEQFVGDEPLVDAPCDAASSSSSAVDEPPLPHPPIAHGEPIVDRKSCFQGHAAHVTSLADVQAVLRALRSDRKIEKATHNIVAYRFFDAAKAALVADNDDDGEDAAGGRLAHLLAIRGCQDVVVVVSRWYGGIPLGPARFKHINTAARSAIDQLAAAPTLNNR